MRIRHLVAGLSAVVFIGIANPRGLAQDPGLAGYFGFDGLEVVKIGRFAGPLSVADINGDGLMDLIAVNNYASRIEVHIQKPGARPTDAATAPTEVNEFPEHWRYRRENVSVVHQVLAVAVHDFDADGLPDLIYAGQPAEVVFMRQTEPGVFKMARRHRVRRLEANRNGLVVRDVQGDARPELVAIVDGNVEIWPLDGDSLGQPRTLATNTDIVALIIEDFNGDERADIVGVIPDDPAPIRLWLGDDENGLGVIGPQLRFEMPPLHEADAVRLPGESAARLAVIERPTRRIVMYDVAEEQLAATGAREAAIHVHGFTDAGNRNRDYALVDLQGSGQPDLIATDTEANALVVYEQASGKSFQSGVKYPSLSDLEYVVAGNVDDDPYAEIFVLSEKEGVVGRSDADATGIPFPRPVKLPTGFTPVALNLVELEHGPHLAIVMKDGRDHIVALVEMDGTIEKIELGKLSRSPETIVALDADQNGVTDLLLFMREKPMTMLYASEDGFTLTEADDMGQFGLVKAAAAENIAILDVDGDDRAELLIADKNYVRAVRYEPEPDPGVSPGWQVVQQINARDRDSKLESLAILGDRVVAADGDNDRLLIMRQDDRGIWSEDDSVTIRGFSFDTIHAGAFGTDERDSILAIGADGFAVVRTHGTRTTLEEFASYRSSSERRVPHELAYGDVNGDGFTDMVVLDAGEQMCDIFTFSEARRLLFATGFQTFESQIFSSGDTREFQPSQVIIEDVTDDGAADIVLLAHDRVLIYPQMATSDE